MSGFINYFKQTAAASQIEDPNEVNKLYKYWRIRIFYSMFIGYALYYFTRKSFTYAMPGLIADLGFDKKDLGLLGSILAISYGVSKFASGILSDRSNPRYFMAFGLMMTGVFNIFFGFSSSLLLFAIFWGLNGWFQGFGWPPCARFLTYWYSQSERGSWWSSWNVSHNLGAAITPWIIGFCLYLTGDWRVGMYVPGVLCILGGLFLIDRLRDTPQSLGLPSVEAYRNDHMGLKNQEGSDSLPWKDLLIEYVLKNKYIWFLTAAYFFVGAVRTGINDWTALFLLEKKGYAIMKSNILASMFEVGGFFGSLAAGWGSDYIFKAKRGPVNVIFSLGMMLAITAFWYVPEGYAYLDGVALFAIGFFTFGPQLLIGMCAAELSHKKAAATATGFAGCFCYLGAAAAGYPLGRILEASGWDAFFWSLTSCCGILALLLVPLWNVKESKQIIKAPAKELLKA